MDKIKIYARFLQFSFLLIFNVPFFLIVGFDLSPSTWLSYGFIHFSYLMLVVTPEFLRKFKNSAVVDYSVYLISSVYLIIQLIVGVFLIILFPNQFKVNFIIQFLLAMTYLAIFFLVLLVREKVKTKDKEIKSQRNYIQEATLELQEIMETVTDNNLKKKLEKAYDAMRTAQIKSSASVVETEIDILEQIAFLKSTINSTLTKETDMQIQKLIAIINKRERKIRSNN